MVGHLIRLIVIYLVAVFISAEALHRIARVGPEGAVHVADVVVDVVLFPRGAAQ